MDNIHGGRDAPGRKRTWVPASTHRRASRRVAGHLSHKGLRTPSYGRARFRPDRCQPAHPRSSLDGIRRAAPYEGKGAIEFVDATSRAFPATSMRLSSREPESWNGHPGIELARPPRAV